MKKLLVFLAMIGTISVVIMGCSMFDSMSQSHHESKSTVADLPVPLNVLSIAIEKAVPQAGFSVSKTKDNVLDKEFTGDNIMITAKKIDDKTSKLFVRVGFAGDPTKEGVIIAEIKKYMGIK